MNFDLTPLWPALDNWVGRTLETTSALTFTPLPGANSTALYRVSTPDGESCVLRLFSNRLWLDSEPDLAQHEAAVLQHAVSHGLPAPCLLAFTAADSPFGLPAILMEFLPGAVELNPPEFTPWLNQLAGELARIHATPSVGFAWQFHTWNAIHGGPAPAWLADSDWQRLLALAQSPPPESAEVFLHRDYHPANILWQDHRISGIVDWVNGCRGPRGVDVAHCRLNLALLYGLPVADAFLEMYAAAVGGYDHHPHWDVDDALSWLPEADFYEPWAEFGRPRHSATAMQDRMRAFLLAALQRL